MADGHPVIAMLAFADSDVHERDVEQMRLRAGELADSRDDWLVVPPEFTDSTDEHGDRTVGFLHRIHSAFDADGVLLEEALDRRALDEVRAVLEAVEETSAETGVDFGIELDGESVGWVEDGRVSDALQRGLLDEWAARFEAGPGNGFR